MKVKKGIKPWAVVMNGWPVSGSIAHTKKRAIKEFVTGTEETWENWRRKHGYRCERGIWTPTRPIRDAARKSR